MDILLVIMAIVVLLAAIGIVFIIMMDVIEIPNVIRFKKEDKTEKETTIETPKTKITLGAILKSDLSISNKDVGIIKDGVIVYPKIAEVFTQEDPIHNILIINIRGEFDYDDVYELTMNRKDNNR